MIGTGASGVQVVPHIAEWAEHLYVFQRTPSSVDIKHNPETDPEWARLLPPGWHMHRRDNFNALVSGVPQEEDLVDDGWTDLIGNLMKLVQGGDGVDLSPEGIQRAVELADLQKMEQIRGRVGRACRRLRDRRAPQALLPAILQATLHPQRLPPHVQSPKRDPRRHVGQGR